MAARKHKPKLGRPVTVDADGAQLIRAPQALLDAMTSRAKRDGVSASELWREAARRLLAQNE